MGQDFLDIQYIICLMSHFIYLYQIWETDLLLPRPEGRPGAFLVGTSQVSLFKKLGINYFSYNRVLRALFLKNHIKLRLFQSFNLFLQASRYWTSPPAPSASSSSISWAWQATPRSMWPSASRMSTLWCIYPAFVNTALTPCSNGATILGNCRTQIDVHNLINMAINHINS